MDRVGLATLESEIRQDLVVMTDALAAARDRLAQPPPAGLEACAHQLCRLYNAFDQMGLRISKAFENHIDDGAGWHSTVLNRLALEIPGVRPAVIPASLKAPLGELKGFRHVFVHAYELVLDRGRIEALLRHAETAVAALPDRLGAFLAAVARGIE